MKVLFHNFYNTLNENNSLFENENSAIGDNLLRPFNALVSAFEEQKISVGTYSKIPLNEADAFVFIDYPKAHDQVFEYAKKTVGKKKYLIILESPIVNLDNFNTKLHSIFDIIFTWSDEMVESNPAKYKKIFYSYDIPNTITIGKRNRLCTVISGNKLSTLPNELYSERLKCIQWFEKNAPSDFDLFGTNWEIVKFESETLKGKLLNRINKKFKLFKYNFKVYKGKVNRKNEVLARYNFCLCFENVANHKGYITEKIFDCFFAGTIPIYKGANNILKYIPQKCFIDYNQFNSTAELYKYISELNENEIISYQKNIHDYLNSIEIQQFSINTFCQTLVKNIQ